MRVTELSSNEAVLWSARALIWLGAIAACLWQPAFYIFVGSFVLGFLTFMAQRWLIFQPTRREYRSPRRMQLTGVGEIWLNTPDGEQLLTWQIKPKSGMPTILYLHGNYCNLSNRLERINRFLHDGYGLIMPSLRGYGLSTGGPSERNNVNDALLAYRALRESGVARKDIVVYGESLGTGIAIQLAAKRSIGALILEAPYTSLADIVRHRLRMIPAYLFLKDEFNSIEHIKKVTAPLLIVHSLGDDVIPIAFGRWLFDAAIGPKEFLRVRGAGHYGLFRAGVWPKIRAFIEQNVKGAGENGEQVRRALAAKSEAKIKRLVSKTARPVEEKGVYVSRG